MALAVESGLVGTLERSMPDGARRASAIWPSHSMGWRLEVTTVTAAKSCLLADRRDDRVGSRHGREPGCHALRADGAKENTDVDRSSPREFINAG